MNLQEIIFDLCRAGGVSGDEGCAQRAAVKHLEKLCVVSTDSNGNVYAFLGNQNAEKTILLDAHLDRIGFMVTDINSEGFVKLEACGGIDARTLADTVLVTRDSLTCTICCLPPHLSDGDDKAAPLSKCWGDFGMTAEEVNRRVKIGDALTFYSQPANLLGDKISAPALDNRCSVAALIRAAELIDKNATFRVVILLSAQEETYAAGAVTGAYKLNADEAICVDVSFASQPDVSGQYAGIGLQKGPMIGVSPVLDRHMTDVLIALAKDEGIPYQLEALSGRTGTNADHIAVSRGGVKTALISIPERYMHTPNEVISLSDVENTARLIANYINCGGDTSV